MRYSSKLAVICGMTALAVFILTASFATATTTIPNFTPSVHVTDTLAGCRNDGSITLPNGSGQFVCPTTAYTTGNLGKGWNELDLVPFQLTTNLGTQSTATTSYNVVVAGDHQAGTAVGWDVISAPTVNSSSDTSCRVSVVQQSPNNGALDPNNTIGPSLAGGADDSIYEVLSIQQAKGTTCVFDYYMRLALGAHNYSGSSLQAYLFETADFSGGQSDVPLPVNEILPQSLSKDMSATRDTNTPWTVTKSPTPATVDLGNQCDPANTHTAGVSVTITATKLDPVPSGSVLLVTHVYATNPSSRTITVDVTDKMYEGTAQTVQVGNTADSGPIDVTANTTKLILTDSQTVSDASTHFNDVATATYTDKVTGIPVPGDTQATAGADVSSGTNTNGSSTVTDSESITGSGLSFKSGLPSTLAGSFIAPSEAGAAVAYTANTYTVGPVTWSSGSQSSSWSTTFSKTIKVDPVQITSGVLSDTANLVGSDGFTTSYGPLNINVSSSATATLHIRKTIPDVLTSTETATFTFHVKASNNAAAADVASTSVTFTAGQTDKTVDVSNLAPGTYYVFEDTASGWNAQTSHSVDLTGVTCSATTRFDNTFTNATAFANKVTDPTGYQADWTFTLTKPGGSTLTGTTDSSGHVVWTGGSSTSTALATEGTYTVSETHQTGWTETGAAQASSGSTGTVTGGTGSSATCSFTVNYPADAGKAFGCTITNKSRGSIAVHKTVSGAAPSGTQSFTFTLRQGATAIIGHPGTILETETANAGNGGNVTFNYQIVPGQTYQLCEDIQAGWQSNLGPNPFVPEQFLTDGVTLNPAVNNSPVCVNFSLTPADTVATKTFNVDNTPPPGGRALTIGYWKNHGSCSTSSGNNLRGQLDTVLASFPIASGQTTHGVYIGNEYVDTCTEAVALLNKQDYKTGKKMASDPLYNLAAQLLAYQLNIQAGAGSCGAAVTAATAAQNLLVKYNFTGTGAYANKMTAQDQQLANSLEHQLDLYNNDLLC